MSGTVDPARLAAVISPLRRVLLASARAAEHLPELPEAQIEIIRALPRGVVSSPGDLAEQLGVSRSTVSNLLTAMEDAGLVARRAATDDRRRVEVLASARALTLFERFDQASAALVGEATASLSSADQHALADALPALEHLRDALVAQRGAAASTNHERSDPKSPQTSKEAE